jgi:hypothetical protein
MDLILKFNEGGTIPAEICAACRGSRNEKDEEAYGKKEEGKTKGCGHLKNQDPDPEFGSAIGKNAGSGSALNQCGSETQKRGQMVGKKKGRLKAVDTFRMALKYKTMTEEERRADRLDRYRWREGWERDTIERRFCYTTATAVALAMEEQEDSVLEVVAADFVGKDAVLQGMRRTATDLQ